MVKIACEEVAIVALEIVEEAIEPPVTALLKEEVGIKLSATHILSLLASIYPNLHVWHFFTETHNSQFLILQFSISNFIS
mmetsp:Transcript_11737/g.10370  ORF Transcript_11737/g.10370 Transcript_11737/m.10370 type:complete len:80 (-) Transcript_11737:1702-1941(-)